MIFFSAISISCLFSIELSLEKYSRPVDLSQFETFKAHYFDSIAQKTMENIFNFDGIQFLPVIY